MLHLSLLCAINRYVSIKANSVKYTKGNSKYRNCGGNVMKNIFNSNAWNTFALVVLGFVAFFTKEIVTFVMLGFVMIMLSNIYDKLDDISKQADNK